MQEWTCYLFPKNGSALPGIRGFLLKPSCVQHAARILQQNRARVKKECRGFTQKPCRSSVEGVAFYQTFLSMNVDENGNRYGAVFEEKHFASGASRYAFRGKYQGEGPKRDNPCVVKVFKYEYAKNIDCLEADLGASKKAKMFAQMFCSNYLMNAGISSNAKSYSIQFLIPLLAKIDDPSKKSMILNHYGIVLSQEYVAIEPFLDGYYQKFNSNGGFENRAQKVMQTFTHWTWQISGGKFMVADLQGIQLGKKYYLTDPAIHSIEQLYGPTDLGACGMEMVLRNHQCNEYCKNLGLMNPFANHPAGFYIPTRATTYSFQLTEEQRLRNRLARK